MSLPIVIALMAALVFANRSLAQDSLAASRARGDSIAATMVRGDSIAAEDSVDPSVAASESVASERIENTSFPPPRVRAWQVGLTRGDRLEHASLSFAVTSALIIATRDRAAGAATAFALGTAKELWDRRTGHFDPVDLAADAVGIGLATVLVAPRGP